MIRLSTIRSDKIEFKDKHLVCHCFQYTRKQNHGKINPKMVLNLSDGDILRMKSAAFGDDRNKALKLIK